MHPLLFLTSLKFICTLIFNAALFDSSGIDIADNSYNALRWNHVRSPKDEILVADKRRQKSCFAGSVPAVQTAIDRCGSVHDLHLTRLLNANRMILVEAKYLKIIKEFQDTICPTSNKPIQSLPNISIGWWGELKLTMGTSMGFHNALC